MPHEGDKAGRLPEDPSERRQALLERRRLIESRRGAQFVTPRRSGFSLGSLAAAIYVWAGFHRRRRLAQPVLNRITLRVRHLPAGLAGLRILHLSDPHFRPRDSLAQRTCDAIGDAQADLCAITGDLPFWSFGPCPHVFAGIRSILEGRRFPLGVYAVLGNHDTLRFADGLASLGVRTLLNEHCLLEWNGAAFALGGVDDPRYFGTDDAPLAFHGAPAGVLRFLLAHSPEAYREAAEAGAVLYLCGHTHGGQVCLPGGRPIIRNAQAPNRLCAGTWRYRGMTGYTTRGLGTGLVALRLNCPPEAALLTLARDEGPPTPA